MRVLNWLMAQVAATWDWIASAAQLTGPDPEPAPDRESPLRRGAEMLRLIEALARQRAHAEMRLKARYGRAFSKPSPAPAERAFEQLYIDRGRQAACLEIESELGITKPVQQRVYELRMGKTGNPREDSYFD